MHSISECKNELIIYFSKKASTHLAFSIKVFSGILTLRRVGKSLGARINADREGKIEFLSALLNFYLHSIYILFILLLYN